MTPAPRRWCAPLPAVHATAICRGAGALTGSRTSALSFQQILPTELANRSWRSILAVVRRELLLERSKFGERRVGIDRTVAIPAATTAGCLGPQRRAVVALVAAALAEITAT